MHESKLHQTWNLHFQTNHLSSNVRIKQVLGQLVKSLNLLKRTFWEVSVTICEKCRISGLSKMRSNQEHPPQVLLRQGILHCSISFDGNLSKCSLYPGHFVVIQISVVASYYEFTVCVFTDDERFLSKRKAPVGRSIFLP